MKTQKSMPSDEEVRRLQLTGGSTYIISLPKGWVEQLGLKRGSMISVAQMDDLTLRIHPKDMKSEEKPRKALITISDNVSPESLVRRVVAAYVIGYNIIQIKNPSKRIDMRQRYAVKEFTRRKLVGTEILSDIPTELTLQVLLSYSELSVNDALRRMNLISGSMHRDAISTIAADNPQLAREVIAMDDEVDRFSLYITRLLKTAVSDSHILKEVGLRSPRECLGYRLITKSMERMADHAVNIAENSLALMMTNLNEETLNELRKMSEFALAIFENAVECLFEGNYSSADKVLERSGNIKGMEAEAIQKIIKNAPSDDIPALRLIVESILRTAEYGADVAETVLNMSIKNEIMEN